MWNISFLFKDLLYERAFFGQTLERFLSSHQQNSLDWGLFLDTKASRFNKEELSQPVDHLSSSSRRWEIEPPPPPPHFTTPDRLSVLVYCSFCFHYMTNVTVVTCILNDRLILLRTSTVWQMGLRKMTVSRKACAAVALLIILPFLLSLPFSITPPASSPQ